MKERQAVSALSALAQETRLRAFRLLVKNSRDGLAAGDIADQLGVPPATLSFHLKQLAAAGLLESHRAGRSIIYTIRVEGIRELISFLTEDCCEGRSELCVPASCN